MFIANKIRSCPLSGPGCPGSTPTMLKSPLHTARQQKQGPQQEEHKRRPFSSIFHSLTFLLRYNNIYHIHYSGP